MSASGDTFYVNIVEYDAANKCFCKPVKLYCPIVNHYKNWQQKCDRHFKQKLATILPPNAFDPDFYNSTFQDYARCSPVATIKKHKVLSMSLPNPNTEWDDIIRKYNIIKDDTIYFEDITKSKTNDTETNCIKFVYDANAQFLSELAKLALTNKPMIDIKYNEITSNMHDAKYNQSMNVDDGILIGKFRKIISNKLNINEANCSIINVINNTQLKDDNKTLIDHKISDQTKLYIENKKPLLPNQYLFKIYVELEISQRFLVWGYVTEMFNDNNYIIPEAILELLFLFYFIPCFRQNDKIPFTYVGDIVLEQQWKMSQVKNKIALKFYPKVPESQYMRIRNFIDTNTLRGIYFDGKTLYENARGSLMDNKPICCQRTLSKEILTRQHVLIKLIRCNVAHKSFGRLIEMSFVKKCCLLTEFKEIISEFSGIYVKDIGIATTSAMQLKLKSYRKKFFKPNGQRSRWNTVDGVSMWNEDRLTNKSTLGGAPWFQSNGDIIVYVDKTEYE